uniref:Uncharacterized protein n=1 Tax=Panagrolaimus davidi TaxID=227884 RepID=A0A914R5J5_9BILA
MSLWDHVVKMEQVILSVEYNQRHLNVWKEDSRGYNRFYVTPLCTIVTSSLNCSRDEYSNEHRHVLSFHVKLWDSLAAETVKLALTQKSIETKISDILPLPMLLVRLGISQDVTDRISVSKEWRSNQDQPNIIIFELYTRHEHFCEKNGKFLEDAKSDPENFLTRIKLFLEFTMVVGQQATKSLNITGQTFAKSKFFSSLANAHSDKDGIVYLSSTDINKLAREIYRSASYNEEVTSTYVSSEQGSDIIKELSNIIKDQTVQSNDLTKEEWNSVFWDDIFSRPDVQTEYFNDVLKYVEEESIFKYNATKDAQFRENIRRKYRQKSENKIPNKFEFSFKNFGFNNCGRKSENSIIDEKNIQSTQNNEMDTINKEEILKFLKKDNINVRWSGTKFIPKDLLLYRINTRTLKTTGEVFFKRIITTMLQSVQKIEIRPEPSRRTNFDKTISPVYYEELKNQIIVLKQQLNNSITKLDEKIAEIKSDLVNTNQHITNIANNTNNNRDILQQQHNVLRNDHNGLRSEFNDLNSWTRKDFWNHVQGLFRHADNIWMRSFHGEVPKNIQETYKSRWGAYPLKGTDFK